MRIAFYPGCLVLQRMPQYELATRAVLGGLGIELELVQQSVCCGSPVVESFSADWVHLAAYNLALVERMGHTKVVTVCGGCTNTLTRAAVALEDPEVRAEANRRLAPLDLSPTGNVEVEHLLHLLVEREGDLRQRIVRSLPVRVALTNPCQAYRPRDVMGARGSDEPPDDLRRLVTLTGAEVVEYGGEGECCGATLYLADQDLALRVGRQKLENTEESDLLLHACGNCHLLLRRFQPMMVRGEPGLRRDALLLPQLLGLALGFSEEELGLRKDPCA